MRALETDAVLAERVQRLATIPGVGRVIALTWALEMGDITRFAPVKKAASYCGLCGAEKTSGGKTERTPISKQRNKHKGACRQCGVLESIHLSIFLTIE
jgi:transposase